MRPSLAVLAAVASSACLDAFASFHLWQVNEFYSNAWGNVQFVELTAQAPGQQFLAGHTITSTDGTSTRSFTFPNPLPGDSAGRRMVIGTQSFAAMGIVAPDYVVPDGFFFRGNFRIDFAGGFDVWDNSSGAMTVPTDGVLSLARNGVTDTNSPLNFSGVGATVFPLPLAADMNGDGWSDIVWRNVETGQVYRMTMESGGIRSQEMVFVEPDTQWTVVGDGDFNGDGRSDLLWRNAATGHVYVMPFDANGRPVAGAVVYTEPNAAWRIIRTPDLDGDGRSDILWYNATTGQLYAVLMNGLAAGTQGMVHTEPNTAWRVVATGDFGRVGRDQIVWRNSGTGDVYLMNVTVVGGGFQTSGQIVYSEANSAWSIVGAGDFDGDLRHDLLWRNAQTGQVFVLLMNGTAVKGGGLLHTEPDANWRIVALGDYNGDFRADILWRNASTGQLFQMLVDGVTVIHGLVLHTEPSAAWRVLGPREYAVAE